MREGARFLSLTEQLCRFFRTSSSGETGDLPFYDGQFNTPDTRGFASTVDSGDCCLLEIIDSHGAWLDLATQQER
jgi:hypothetical protein